MTVNFIVILFHVFLQLLVIEQRHHDERQERRGDGTADERDGQSLEDGVEENDHGSDDHTACGEQDGRSAHGSRLNDGLLERHAFLEAKVDEVDEQDGVAHHDAGFD